MKVKAFRGRNHCPICGGNKDCVEVPEPKDFSRLIWCKANDGKKGDKRADGFVCVSGQHEVNGLLQAWGIPLPGDRAKPDTFVSHGPPIKKRGRPPTPPGHQMPVEARHAAYSQIVAALDLGDRELADLLRRGFSLERVNGIGYRTLPKLLPQSVRHLRPPGFLSDGKPAVDFDGTDGDAYLCPAKDWRGNIQSFQVRLFGGDRKYVWLASSHLPNGELPLSVCYPESVRDSSKCATILFCEGINPKPQLIADLWGLPCIGASGGNFASSELSLREQIKGVMSGLDISQGIRFVFVPDAWAIGNEHVCQRDTKTIELLQAIATEINKSFSEGQPKIIVRVASWGQACDPSASDGDEIDLSQVKLSLLAPQKYWEQQPTPAQKAAAAVKKYIKDNPRPSRSNLKDRLEINAIALKVDLPTQEIQAIWQDYESDNRDFCAGPDKDLVESLVSGIPVAIAKKSGKPVSEHEKLSHYLVETTEIFGQPGFCQQLQRYCACLGVPEMAALFALSPIVASIINPRTTITGMESSGFKERPSSWTMLLGDSGASKTPLCSALTWPLFAIQREENQLSYFPAYEQWVQTPAKQRKAEPKMFTAVVTNATTEAITNCQAANGYRGILAYFEEMGKIFSLDRYQKSGGGRQELLELRGGNAASVRRVGKGGSVDMEINAIQILGGLQPLVFRQAFSSDDPDGLLARFNIAFIPRAMGAWDDGPAMMIAVRFRRLLEIIRAYPPQSHAFSDVAMGRFREWFEHCNCLKMQASTRPMAATFSKSIAEALRRALELHYINHALSCSDASIPPPLAIPLEILDRAFLLCENQFEMTKAVASMAIADKVAESYATIIQASRRAGILDLAGAGSGWVSATNVSKSNTKNSSVSVSEAASLFRAMSTHGFGELREHRGDLEFRSHQTELDKLAHKRGGAKFDSRNVHDPCDTGIFSKRKQSTPPSVAEQLAAASDGSFVDLLGSLDPHVIEDAIASSPAVKARYDNLIHQQANS